MEAGVGKMFEKLMGGAIIQVPRVYIYIAINHISWFSIETSFEFWNQGRTKQKKKRWVGSDTNL